jgi:hypothetical protein
VGLAAIAWVPAWLLSVIGRIRWRGTMYYSRLIGRTMAASAAAALVLLPLTSWLSADITSPASVMGLLWTLTLAALPVVAGTECVLRFGHRLVHRLALAGGSIRPTAPPPL